MKHPVRLQVEYFVLSKSNFKNTLLRHQKKMFINKFVSDEIKIDLLMTKLECFQIIHAFRKVSSKRKLILPIKSHSPFGIKLLMSPPLPSFRVRSSWKLNDFKGTGFH